MSICNNYGFIGIDPWEKVQWRQKITVICNVVVPLIFNIFSKFDSILVDVKYFYVFHDLSTKYAYIWRYRFSFCITNW